MRIDANGNIGVGTINPLSLFSVNGTITAQAFTVVNSGWSDYVFRPDYRLMPLGEVRSYIRQYHHLPGIPSEEEVKAKGAEVGDMQARLLAKIEELTLHMIQAEDRNQALEARIAQLEKAK